MRDVLLFIFGAMFGSGVGAKYVWHQRGRLATLEADMLCACLDEKSTAATTATAALGNALDERAAALVRAAIAEGLLKEAYGLLADLGIPVPAPVTVP